MDAVDVVVPPEPEEALRASAERHAYLLALADELQAVHDPVEIQEAASRLLAERLDVARVAYVECDEDAGTAVIHRDHLRHAAPSTVGTYRLADFGDHIDALRRGDVVVLDDALVADVTPAASAAYETYAIRSQIVVGLVRDGRLVALLEASHTRPRRWRPLDVRLVVDTAERTRAAVEHARAEAALRAQEAEYRALFESIDEGLAVCDAVRDAEGRVVDIQILDVNPAFERQLGRLRAHAVGHRASEVLPPEPEVHARIGAAVDAGSTARFELHYRALGRWFDVRVLPRGGERFVVIFDDVTARREAERVLRESAERHAFRLALTEALGPLRDPVAVGRAIERVVRERLGASRVRYADGADALRVVAPYGAAALARVRAGHRVLVAEVASSSLVRGLPRDALVASGIASVLVAGRRLDDRCVAVVTVEGSTPHAWTGLEAALVEEAAERGWAASELARAEAAAAAERVRREEREREFVADAAHELRTPLTAILAAVGALDAGADDVPEQRHALFGHLRREGERLARLADGLLQLAQADAGERVPLARACVRSILDDVATATPARPGVEVRVEAADGLAAMTHVGLLERVLANLAANAARHTDAGSIVLAAHQAPDGGIVIEVRDTGSGIDDATAARAFDRFYRGGDRSGEGFGLGLSIAGRCAEAIGARLALAPRDDGAGAVARVELPR